MPKKSRKLKQRAAMRRTGPAAAGAVVVEEQSTDVSAAMTETPIRMRTGALGVKPASPLNYDYSHIYGDLKRIAVFAGFFFAVLVILSFVIK